MPRGGSRKHPEGCTCGNCPAIGRKKGKRVSDAKMAARIRERAHVEQVYLSLIELECRRLGIDFANGHLLPAPKKKNRDAEADGVIDGPDYQGRFSIIPLTNLLKYLDDRLEGKPHETVHHVHNKPQDLHVTLSVSARMRESMTKAEKRLLQLVKK